MLTRDRRKIRNPVRARRAETQFAAKLKGVAKQVGQLINSFDVIANPETVPTVRTMLENYAKALEPWATAVVTRMLAEVNSRDAKTWATQAQEMGIALRKELHNAPTGQAMRKLMAEQVQLITSLPTDAAQRVHDLVIKGLEDSARADEIAREIRRSGEVTESRAKLIARTEVARSASTLTQARAEYIGSEGYVWRTSGDSDVRHSHKQMEGKFVRWDSPPTLSDGTTTHAGQIYNCRCYPEPVIPEA